MDCSRPGSSVHRLLQARLLEWVAISYFRGSFQLRNWTRIPCIGSQTFLPLSHQASPLFCTPLQFKGWSLDQIPQYSSPGNLLNSHLRPHPRITLTRCPGGWYDIKIWEALLWETPFRGESTTNFNIFMWLIISRHLLLLSPNAYFTNNHTYFFLTVLCKALF